MATSRQVDLTFDLAYPTEHYKFLQRLGERRSTDIVVQIYNKGIPYNISGTILGFEMRNDRNKVVIDKEQSRFTKVTPLQGVFSYKPPEEVQSFYGNAYLAYFTLENGADRVTTERFRFYNDEDVQACIAPDLQEHYVSVIDDLVASNGAAMDKANEIKNLIETNQVVKKAGDIMSGNLLMENPNGAISTRYFAGPIGGTGVQVGWESLTNGTFRIYDWKNNRNVLSYNPVTDYISFNRNHPYVTKTGDTISGDLNVVDNKGISFMDATDPNKRKAYLSSGGNVTSLYDSLSSGRVWWYDHYTQTFTVDKNTNLMKKTDYSGKDGRYLIALTSEATNTNANYMPSAIRRGNTVTVKMAISRNAGSVSALVATLPIGYRPIELLSHATVATDGSKVDVDIATNGQINVWTAGKNFSFVTTYVVD
ncbi:BppU family phage baseplate upper protein [Bacillus cereus]|uniref:BppU family phage baseplate upper protein n=1 Tax=Bacillus cereus TaxID=1396 RepID=UPI003CE7B765